MMDTIALLKKLTESEALSGCENELKNVLTDICPHTEMYIQIR